MTVTPKVVSDAVGGIWSTTEEFQQFAKYLSNRAADGKLMLEGMDDQLSDTSEYTQGTMAADLADFLNSPEKEGDYILDKRR